MVQSFVLVVNGTDLLRVASQSSDRVLKYGGVLNVFLGKTQPDLTQLLGEQREEVVQKLSRFTL